MLKPSHQVYGILVEASRIVVNDGIEYTAIALTLTYIGETNNKTVV